MSSGSMAADRRFDYARDLLSCGDLVAAADLLMQAIELAPHFASAWFTLGEAREMAGDAQGAMVAFRGARDNDLSDRNGAALRLMRLGAEALQAMPAAYVTTLFDQYAPKFEASLVGELGYRGPALLFDAVMATRRAQGGAARFRRIIDVGCGTGLVARVFAADADEMIGIDLSAGMIRQAAATRLYAELQVADAVDGLKRQPGGRADLVVAADVMIYLHDLAPLMREAARVLTPGGLFAFTAETHNDGAAVVLGAGLRYAQSAMHLRELIANVGLTLDFCEGISIRSEKKVAVPGLVMVTSKA